MSEIRVYVRHVRAAKICMGGTRRWFEQAGLDWNAFLASGMAADDVRALDNPMADRALAEAEREAR